MNNTLMNLNESLQNSIDNVAINNKDYELIKLELENINEQLVKTKLNVSILEEELEKSRRMNKIAWAVGIPIGIAVGVGISGIVYAVVK